MDRFYIGTCCELPLSENEISIPKVTTVGTTTVKTTTTTTTTTEMPTTEDFSTDEPETTTLVSSATSSTTNIAISTTASPTKLPTHNHYNDTIMESSKQDEYFFSNGTFRGIHNTSSGMNSKKTN